MIRIQSPQSILTCKWGISPSCVRAGSVSLFETGKCCIPCNRVRLQQSQRRFQERQRAKNRPSMTIDPIRFVKPRIKTVTVPRVLTDEEILADTIDLLAGNI